MPRPTLSPLMLKLITAAFMLAVHNNTFWSRAGSVFDGEPGNLIQFGIIVFAVILFTLAVLTLPRLQKPMLILALFVAAIGSHYQDRLGVVIDRDMIHNAVTTTTAEAKHLITPAFALHLFLTAFLPSLFVLAVRLRRRNLLWESLGWAGTIALSLAIFAGTVLSDFKTFSAVIREHRELNNAIQPSTPFAGAFNYVKLMYRARDIVAAPLGTDAKKGPRLEAAAKPSLTIIVVGETARAQNWSLNGYDRETNPELKKRNVLYFPSTIACGTSTAVSMPCMFAHYGMAKHSYNASRASENLLDVLSHAGFKVKWFDNNTGHLGVGARVESQMMTELANPTSCAKGECEDSVFLPVLDEILSKITEDTVIVYHQIGSHGPAYFMRYPDGFKPFAPDCQTVEFGNCTNEEIVNAYDNTIAFTDLFLSQIIDKLQASDKAIGSMFFVSDHGESLGENGIYLHAAPYFMAPDVQTHVPMLFWMSDAYKSAFKVDEACIAAKAAEQKTHDNVFHTLLGLTDVETEVKNPELDLLEGCHG